MIQKDMKRLTSFAIAYRYSYLQPADDYRRRRTPLSHFVTSNVSKHQPTACLLARFFQHCSCLFSQSRMHQNPVFCIRKGDPSCTQPGAVLRNAGAPLLLLGWLCLRCDGKLCFCRQNCNNSCIGVIQLYEST